MSEIPLYWKPSAQTAPCAGRQTLLDSGCRVQGAGFRVQGAGCRVCEVRVSGSSTGAGCEKLADEAGRST